MKKEALSKLSSVSLKARILRTFQKSNRADDEQYSERELFTLELINDFGPVTEKSLSKIFGLPFSSISDLIKKLSDAKLIDTTEKMRGKPLELTREGVERLNKIKQTSAIRFGYLFETVGEDEWEVLISILNKIDKQAEKTIQNLVFDRYSIE